MTYKANSKVWMRSDIFIEWLNDLDYYFRTLDKKILLLIDNARSQKVKMILIMIKNQVKVLTKNNNKKIYIKLTNIELVYLSPNITAHLQPMDAGIIHSFKAKYKQEFCKNIICQFDSGIDYVK